LLFHGLILCTEERGFLQMREWMKEEISSRSAENRRQQGAFGDEILAAAARFSDANQG
jgi:hypothetical protein